MLAPKDSQDDVKPLWKKWEGDSNRSAKTARHAGWYVFDRNVVRSSRQLASKDISLACKSVLLLAFVSYGNKTVGDKAADKPLHLLTIFTVILDALQTALSNLDWSFVTPSRIDYTGAGPAEIAAQAWQERLFAYELYHQLRLLWTEQASLRAHCVIHAEVRKGYQHIAGFDYMPDFLFHLPQVNQNRAVAEIKLAARSPAEIATDLDKLVRFHTQFAYDDLIEILVGRDRDFERVIPSLSSPTGTKIHLLCLSTDTKLTTHKIIKYHKA
jgi:hypothetical protein